MKDFLKKLYEKIFQYLKKNNLNITLWIGINFLLLCIMKYYFITIKTFLNYVIHYIEKFFIYFTGINEFDNIPGIKELINKGFFKFLILLALSVQTLLVLPLFFLSLIPVYPFSSFKITDKNIKKTAIFFGFTFLFQILSISKEKNIYTVNNLIIVSVFCLLVNFSVKRITPSNDKYNSRMIILETIVILISIIKNQLSIESHEVFAFYFVRSIIMGFISTFFFMKFLIFIDGYDFEKIEIESKNIFFNHNKINFIDKNIQQGKKILNFSFKNINIKKNFIYNIKRIYNQKYNVIYRNKLYYLNDWHFERSIKKNHLSKSLRKFFGEEVENEYENEKLYNMLIIDNVKKNMTNKFENIKNKFKFDVLITLSMEDDLFSSRREDTKKLKENIDSEKNSILIDNIWGNGKTFFIKKFMDKYNDNFEFIYIKVPYFDTKMEFRKKILVEINRIFKKNNIITSSLKDLMSYFNINNENIKLGFMSFDFNKFINGNMYDDYREVLINIKNNLKYLKKKIVIILDDFDRMENKKQILEVLNFIGELNIELNESLTLITLSSYEKLISIMEKDENVKEGKKCLEKYFDKIFYLSNTNFFELIEFFLDVYDINLKKRNILKEIINLINKHNEKLLTNEKINFRNVERFIKRIKEMNIKLDIGIKEYRIIYEKIFILWEIIEYLIPDYWNELKKINTNIKNRKTNENYQKISSFYKYISQELRLQNKLENIKSEKEEEFVSSILESVRKYKLGEYSNPIFYYLDIKEKMLKIQEGNKINRLWKYEDYQKVNEIFDFQIEERKKIFNFFMLNKDINKYETLELMIQYKLNYNWKYKNSMEFFKNLKNKEEGELLSDKRTNGKFYIFLKNLLLVNLFIDINKMENLEEQEKGLHSKNTATGYFLKSNDEFSNFFIPFLRKGIEEEEYNNFVQEICKIRKNTEQNIINHDVKTNIELLKSELVNVNYLEKNLTKNLEEIKTIKEGLEKLGKKEQDKVLNFLKEKDESLYEMWIDYLISKQE